MIDMQEIVARRKALIEAGLPKDVANVFAGVRNLEGWSEATARRIQDCKARGMIPEVYEADERLLEYFPLVREILEAE